RRNNCIRRLLIAWELREEPPSRIPARGGCMAKRAKKRATKKTAARRPRKAPKMLKDLFLDTLKDIYFAENKIIKTLPKMAKAAQSKDLAAAFNKHLR